MAENRFFIGVDDTDSPSSKGTGYLTRELCKEIEANNLGKVINITRHQLFVSEKIKYTNRNKSACIEVNTTNLHELLNFCKEYVLRYAEPKANPVIISCLASEVSEAAIEFGKKAKSHVMNLKQAEVVLKNEGFNVVYIKKNKNGLVGALAAIGLRATGNDGRVIWVNGHELIGLVGQYLAGEVYCETHVDSIKTIDGFKVPINAHINFDNILIKPVFKENAVTLIVEELSENKIEDLGCNNFKAIIS